MHNEGTSSTKQLEVDINTLVGVDLEEPEQPEPPGGQDEREE